LYGLYYIINEGISKFTVLVVWKIDKKYSIILLELN